MMRRVKWMNVRSTFGQNTLPALLALVVIGCQAALASDRSSALAASTPEDRPSAEASELRLRVSPGDVLKLKHKIKVTVKREESASSRSLAAQTTLIVLDADDKGALSVYGQCSSKPANESPDRWGVYTFTTDRSGRVLSFPARDWIFGAKKIQNGDLSWGSLLPFTLPMRARDESEKWEARFYGSPLDKHPFAVEARIGGPLEGNVIPIAMTGRLTPDGYEADVDMVLSFDTLRGLPVSWSGTMTTTALAAGASLEIECQTELRCDRRSDPAELRSLREIGRNVGEIQQHIEQNDKSGALEKARILEERFSGNAWLRGLQLLREIADQISPCSS